MRVLIRCKQDNMLMLLDNVEEAYINREGSALIVECGEYYRQADIDMNTQLDDINEEIISGFETGKMDFSNILFEDNAIYHEEELG